LIQTLTKVKLIDNSGVLLSKIIGLLNGTKRKKGKIGSNGVIAVKKAKTTSKIKKGSVKKFKILRDKEMLRRKDGTKLLMNENAGILLKDNNSPIGNRLKGPIFREIKKKNKKLMSICKIIL
jgi:large subunit ribosomal protein L14